MSQAPAGKRICLPGGHATEARSGKTPPPGHQLLNEIPARLHALTDSDLITP